MKQILSHEQMSSPPEGEVQETLRTTRDRISRLGVMTLDALDVTGEMTGYVAGRLVGGVTRTTWGFLSGLFNGGSIRKIVADFIHP